MSKVARRLAVSLIIASIMIVSFAGAAFAGGSHDDNGNWPDEADRDQLRDGTGDTCTGDGDGPPWLPLP